MRKEESDKSTEKLVAAPCVTLPGISAPAPLPEVSADSGQTKEGGEQPLQAGRSAEGHIEKNVGQQTAQSEKLELPVSPNPPGLFEGTLIAGPQEPEVLVPQSGSVAGNAADVGGKLEDERRMPGRFTYRPPSVTPPKSRPRAAASPRTAQGEQSRQPLEVTLQAVFDRYGFCQIRLLGQRPPDGEQDVEARSGREAFVLSAYGDAWYEIDVGKNLSAFLSEGFQLSARDSSGVQLSWRLSGRDIYVLAGHHGFAGSVSTTWLRMGRDDQVVLCKAGHVQEVLAVLEQAGCGPLGAYDENYGAPAGWVFFRRVKPLQTLPHASGNDILNVLRPLPEIEIELNDGLWLYDSIWLAGFPPKISVSGDIPPHAEVRIDNHPAVLQANGKFTAPRWDQDGDHIVWCGGKQAKYSIASPLPDWESWQPYDYAGGTVCGAIAIPRHAEHLVTVPTTNCMLLGARPGEFFLCGARASTEWTGFVPFKVVWAVPGNALHSDRNHHRVMLITAISPNLLAETRTFRRTERLAVWRWCQAILDCRRKGLAVRPDDIEAKQLWRNYSNLARNVWRTLRRHGTK